MEVYVKAAAIRQLEKAKEILQTAKVIFSRNGDDNPAFRNTYMKIANIQLEIEALEGELFNSPTTKETQP